MRNEKGQFIKGTYKDKVGLKYGRLTVKSLNRIENKRVYWNCICDCGNQIIRRTDLLKETSSCGCLQKEISSKIMKSVRWNKGRVTHGESKTKLYKTFLGIQGRCYNKTDKSYDNYGGRGIICEWKTYEEFKKDMEESFLEHLSIHGKENTTIERIDVNGNYSKHNCKWATIYEQNNNRRTSVYVKMNDGSKITLKEYSVLSNESYSTINARYRRSPYYGTKLVPENEIKRKHRAN